MMTCAGTFDMFAQARRQYPGADWDTFVLQSDWTYVYYHEAGSSEQLEILKPERKEYTALCITDYLHA